MKTLIEDIFLFHGIGRSPYEIDRVYKAWQEIFFGSITPDDMVATVKKGIFIKRDSASGSQSVHVEGINTISLCEHHLLPFYGTTSIYYTPDKHILGLSKFPYLVQYLAQKPTLQEYLTDDILHAIKVFLSPISISVTTEMTHMCMCARGRRHDIDKVAITATWHAIDDKKGREESWEKSEV